MPLHSPPPPASLAERHTVPLEERIAKLRDSALRLRDRAADAALRARLDIALLELERIPQAFPDATLARQALLVPAGRIRIVAEILGAITELDG